MSIVSWMVGTADGFLADAAESQFGAVASSTGTIVLLMVTLSLIGVCINMAFQFRSMDGASFFWYLIKLMLIGLFAFNWANFNMIANAVLDHAPLVVQDETGINYTALKQKFNTTLYGKFVMAHQAFQSYHTDLARAYAQRQDVRPLNFRVGYYKDGNYVLMVARRK